MSSLWLQSGKRIFLHTNDQYPMGIVIIYPGNIKIDRYCRKINWP